jgi:hypothetical protein
MIIGIVHLIDLKNSILQNTILQKCMFYDPISVILVLMPPKR